MAKKKTKLKWKKGGHGAITYMNGSKMFIIEKKPQAVELRVYFGYPEQRRLRTTLYFTYIISAKKVAQLIHNG